MARTTKAAQAERETELEWMRKHLQPGDTLFTILDHVSSSGMSRNIRFVILTCHDGKPVQLHPNYAAEKILGYRRAKRGDGVVVGGCGMDMGFHCVYSISRSMFPDGFGVEGNGGIDNDGKPWRPRPKTREEAARMVAAGVKFCGRNGDKSGWDDDGGYALNHRWL